jgi:hypothetical protein
MKSFFTTCAYIIVIGLGIGIYGYVHYTKLEKATVAYTYDAAKAIVTTWNIGELKSRAHPTLTAALRESSKSLEEYFEVYSTLGAFVRMGSCELTPDMATVIGTMKKYKIADYACRSEFKKGDAIIRISLRQDDAEHEGDDPDPWQITTFQVESPLFAKR